MNRNIRPGYINLLFLGIMLLAVFLRIYNINSPLLDENPWRQTDTAAIARNFYQNGFNIFYPQIDWGGASSGFVETEFQIYPFMIAILYKIFGVKEFMGRFISIFFSLGSIIVLYKLIEEIYDQKSALVGTFCFAVSPLSMYYSRTFMPESLLVFCSISAIYFLWKWSITDMPFYYIIASLATMFAILIKLPSLYLGLPIGYLFYRKYGARLFRQKQVWLFGFVTLVPPLVWYWHAHNIFINYHLTFGIVSGGYSKFGNLSTWSSNFFYDTMIKRIVFKITAVLGLPFAIIGFFKKVKGHNYLVHVWLLAFLSYIFIAAEGHKTHDYYQVPLVPILCIFMAQGLIYSLSFIHRMRPCSNLSVKLTFSAFMILFLLLSLIHAKAYYRCDFKRLAFAERIEKYTSKSDLIIIGDGGRSRNILGKHFPGNPMDFYNSNRKGWSINSEDWSLDSIEPLKEQGAKYFATFFPMLNEEFIYRMERYYKLIEKKDHWVIFSLN